MKTHYLSREEREYGRKMLLRHALWNGLSFVLMADAVISLLIIELGATNMQIGYASSILHISGLVLLFMPVLLNGFRIIDVFFFSWVFRGATILCCLSALVLPPNTAIVIVLISYTVYCLLRQTGMAMSLPLQKSLFEPKEAGKTVARIWEQTSMMGLAGRAISFGLLSVRFLSGLPGLLLLQTAGVFTNLIAAFYLRKIPSRERITQRPGDNIFRIFAGVFKDRDRALTVMLNWFTLIQVILFAFVIPFLRKTVNLSNSRVFIYMICGSLGVIAMSKLMKPLGDKIGSRPFLLALNLFAFSLAVLWTFISPRLFWPLYGGLSFFLGFVHAGMFMQVGSLVIRSTPETGRTGYAAMLAFFTALISLAAGMSGGFLADLRAPLTAMHDYSLPIALSGLFALTSFILTLFLKDRESMGLKDAVRLLSSQKDLRSYFAIYNLYDTDSDEKRSAYLIAVEKSSTEMATDVIATHLKKSTWHEKDRALRSLFNNPRPRLLPEILRIAADPLSPNREVAIIVLGVYPDALAVRLLKRIAREKNPFICAAAISSLARLGEKIHVSNVSRFLKRYNVHMGRVYLRYIIALSVYDQRGTYLKDFFNFFKNKKSADLMQEAVNIVSTNHHFTPHSADFFNAINCSPEEGIQDFLFEAKEIIIFSEHQQMITELFTKNNHAITAQCVKILRSFKFKEPYCHLKTAVTGFNRTRPSNTETMMVLYFTLLCLKSVA